MIKLANFHKGQNIPPKDEARRVRAIFNNRELYNNEVLALHALKQEGNTPELKINLFRRAVDIYTNFLLSEGVTITSDNEMTQKIIDGSKDDILSVLYMANTDLKRYGSAVVSVDNMSGTLKAYEPDQWYQVIGEDGRITADIIVEYLTQRVEIDESKDNQAHNYSRVKITISDYDTNKQTIEIRRLDGSTIGDLLADVVTIDIVGRQVATMFNGYNKGQEGLSMFDDIKDIVADMVKIKRTLSNTLDKNGRPHLCGSADMLVEQNGVTTIKKEGMFLPMETGDNPPFYLQWDTNAEAAKYQISEHWAAFFAITAIPPIIFSENTGQATSGEALKRLIFPFLSVLAKQRQSNIIFTRDIFSLLDNYRHIAGMPRMSFETLNIDFEYNKLFIDNQNITDAPEIDPMAND